MIVIAYVVLGLTLIGGLVLAIYSYVMIKDIRERRDKLQREMQEHLRKLEKRYNDTRRHHR